MKMLLVSPESSDLGKLKLILQNNGRNTGSVFHYFHPLKAMDNIDELRPDIIIWSIIDFPRHWKALIPYTQTLAPEDRPKMLLFSNGNIDEREKDKAHTLGVSGLIEQGLDGPEASEKILEVLADFPVMAAAPSTRPEPATAVNPAIVDENDVQDDEIELSLPDAHDFDIQESVQTGADETTTTEQVAVAPAPSLHSAPSLRYDSRSADEIKLILSHPLSLKMVRGSVTGLEPDSLEFTADHAQAISDLPVGALIGGSRLIIDDYRLQLDLKLSKIGDPMELAILNPESDYLPLLQKLISSAQN